MALSALSLRPASCEGRTRLRLRRSRSLLAPVAAAKSSAAEKAAAPVSAPAPAPAAAYPPPPPEYSPWAALPPPPAGFVPPPPSAELAPPPPYAGTPYVAYPGYYPPPPPPPKSEGLPPWMWVAAGVVLAGLGGQLMGLAKSKQADIQQAMVQQMMKSMMGGAAPPGGMPGMPPGFPGGTPPGFPPGGFPPRPAAAPAAAKSPAFDTTATAVKEAAKPAAAAPAPAPAASEEAKPTPPPTPAAPSSGSYFRDADEVVPPPPSASSSYAPPQPPPGMPGGAPPPGMSVDMLENMMRDPNMQKLIYPYLPEGMRNPATFEWMLKNPATRQQLETMLANSGGSIPGMPGAGGFPNLDMNSPEMKAQFDQLGMKPEDVIGKIMAEPEMAAAFQNPRVQAAIMDCSQNPMNISKYQDDKEIMDVFMKISELFPQAGGGMPPPGFGR